MRPGIDLIASPTALFQFTHPGKGATKDAFISAQIAKAFQFTHPGKGATVPSLDLFGIIKFQFTHPGKGATVWCKVAYYKADKQA